MPSTSAALALARQHHQAGRLQAAEQIYRQILQADPNQADAIHLLGVIAHQVGQNEVAVDYIQRAIALDPLAADFHINLAKVYAEMQRLPEAIASGRRALQLQPDSARAHNNLGNALRAQGQLEESVLCSRRALALNPNLVEAHHNLGLALAEQEKWEEAVASYRRALALHPDFAEVHLNLGDALRRQGQWEPAVASYRRAVALKPQLAEAHHHLGNALKDPGSLEEAEACYRQALARKPDFPEAHNNLGVLLKEKRRLDEAVASYRRALALQPGYALAHHNLADAFLDLGLLDQALAGYRRVVELRPDDPEAHYNLGLFLLLRGRYEEGWRECERRLELPASRPRIDAPRWQGEPAAGRALLIRAEQGFGDLLQFVRYVPLVRPRSGAARVILEAEPGLIRLFAQNGGCGAEMVALSRSAEDAPPCDCQVPLLSLPFALGVIEPMPMPEPYLRADAELRRQWRDRLGAPCAAPGTARRAARVGLVWAGSPGNKVNALRSLPAESLLPLVQVPGFHFYSLQVGSPSRQAPALASAGLIDLTAHLTDFADTAAFMAELDLIITVETAVAHLAGAMGLPVWTLLPFRTEWRWGFAGDATPWYPTMRLFRQPAFGDWDAVVQRVAAELLGFV